MVEGSRDGEKVQRPHPRHHRERRLFMARGWFPRGDLRTRGTRRDIPTEYPIPWGGSPDSGIRRRGDRGVPPWSCDRPGPPASRRISTSPKLQQMLGWSGAETAVKPPEQGFDETGSHSVIAVEHRPAALPDHPAVVSACRWPGRVPPNAERRPFRSHQSPSTSGSRLYATRQCQSLNPGNSSGRGGFLGGSRTVPPASRTRG